MGHEILIVFATEQGAQVVVQPAAAVVALIHDDGLAVAVSVAEQLAIDGAETLTVHLLDMDIGQLPTRQAVDQRAVAVHPALVEQFGLLALADGLDGDIKALALLGVIDAHADRFAGLAVEHPIVILALTDLVAVDLLDDAASGHSRLLDGKRATLDDLLHAQAVALIGVVQEQAQRGGLEGGTLGIVTCARV